MNERCVDLTAKMTVEREKTVEFFTNLPESDREKLVYADGMEWSIRDVLAHLVAAELSIAKLIQIVLVGGEGSPVDFDLDRYNQRKVASYRAVEYSNLIRDFVAARTETIAMMEKMVDADLDRTGRHPWLGIAPVEDIIKLMYRHNQIHQRDIRKSLAN